MPRSRTAIETHTGGKLQTKAKGQNAWLRAKCFLAVKPLKERLLRTAAAAAAAADCGPLARTDEASGGHGTQVLSAIVDRYFAGFRHVIESRRLCAAQRCLLLWALGGHQRRRRENRVPARVKARGDAGQVLLEQKGRDGECSRGRALASAVPGGTVGGSGRGRSRRARQAVGAGAAAGGAGLCGQHAQHDEEV